MRVIYIASDFGNKNGTNTNLMMHYKTIISIVGEENVCTIDLNSGGKQILTTDYLAFEKPMKKMSRYRRIIEGHTRYMSNDICSQIFKAIDKQKTDVVFVDESLFGQFIKKLKKKYLGLPVIAFYHDIKRNLYGKWLRQRGLGFLKEYIPGIRNERLTSKYADIHITLNRRESLLLEKYYGISSDLELPVGISCVAPETEERISAEPLQLLFVGANYYPNRQGIEWFCKNVFPMIKDFCELVIVGRGMEVMRDILIDENIKVIGSVNSLDEYYRFSDVVIAPIFDGGGMKVKTAEAFAYGKRFIGTSESLIGYYEYANEEQKELIKMCDTSDAYIKCINDLRGRRIKKWNEEIHRLFVENYSEDAIKRSLEEVLLKAFRKADT